MKRLNVWEKYDEMAKWMARFGRSGHPDEWVLYPERIGNPLRAKLEEDPEAFERRVREMAYGLAMERIEPHQCDGCDERKPDVRSRGRDGNGDPDAPDLCDECATPETWEVSK